MDIILKNMEKENVKPDLANIAFLLGFEAGRKEREKMGSC